MSLKHLLFALSLFAFTPAYADITACAKSAPALCASLESISELKAGQKVSFGVSMNSPIEGLTAEMVWDSAELELRIRSAPEKIVAIDSANYSISGIIAVLPGPWILDVYVKVAGRMHLIQFPVAILPTNG